LLSEFDAAIPSLSESSELNPTWYPARLGLGATLAHLGRVDEAGRVLSTVGRGAVVNFLQAHVAEDLGVLRSGLALAELEV